ncbi:unnamed protein product [Sphagnum tenellum]
MADSDQELLMGVLTIAEVQRVLEKGVSELRNLDCTLEKKMLDIRAREKELRLEKEEIEDQLKNRSDSRFAYNVCLHRINTSLTSFSCPCWFCQSPRKMDDIVP